MNNKQNYMDVNLNDILQKYQKRLEEAELKQVVLEQQLEQAQAYIKQLESKLKDSKEENKEAKSKK